MYETVKSKEDQQRNVLRAYREIEPWMVKKVVASVKDRLLTCTAAEGQNFVHFMELK